MKIYIQKIAGELYGLAYQNGKTYSTTGINHTSVFNSLLTKITLHFND